jgi:hypothetical protein
MNAPTAASDAKWLKTVALHVAYARLAEVECMLTTQRTQLMANRALIAQRRAKLVATSNALNRTFAQLSVGR